MPVARGRGEPPRGCWELNSGPLQQVLLATKPTPQLPYFFFKRTPKQGYFFNRLSMPVFSLQQPQG